MKAVVDFFSSIVDGIRIAFEFLFDMIQDLAYIVKLIGSFVVKIPSLFVWLPSAVVTLLVTTFGIVVIFKIIGRDG